MEDMTVQTVSDFTESFAATADCESAAEVGAVPTQDTSSSKTAEDAALLTDGDAETAEAKSNGDDAVKADYMPVYKGKVYPMAASDTKEITTLLQLGMKQREMQPLMDDLKLLAAQCGVNSIKELVACSKEASNAQALQAAVNTYGEREGRAYFAAQQERLRQNVGQPTDERTSLHERLAAEFCELRREFTDYTSFGQLPKEVVRAALMQSISLTDALLRYQHRQAKCAQVEKTAANRGAAAATGSLRQASEHRSSSAMDAFLRGLHRRL